jgi:hypothetical protein
MTARPDGDFDDVIAFARDGPAGAVADAARLLLLDSLGCMIAGLGHAAPRRFADALAITMPGAVHLPGCAAGLSEAGAAAVLAAPMAARHWPSHRFASRPWRRGGFLSARRITLSRLAMKSLAVPGRFGASDPACMWMGLGMHSALLRRRQGSPVEMRQKWRGPSA